MRKYIYEKGYTVSGKVNGSIKNYFINVRSGI